MAILSCNGRRNSRGAGKKPSRVERWSSGGCCAGGHHGRTGSQPDGRGEAGGGGPNLRGFFPAPLLFLLPLHDRMAIGWVLRGGLCVLGLEPKSR